MVSNQQGMDNPYLQTKNKKPPPRSPPDKEQIYCKVNTIPLIDEYELENFEDEVDRDNQFVQDANDVNDISEALIRAFIPQNDQALKEEDQQVTQNKGLSQRRLLHDKFHFQNKDVKTIIAGRPDSKLFSSRASQ